MKEYQLTPITETAVQATQAKGQKGKIAKQIMLGNAWNRRTSGQLPGVP
jgi:hypothetical protein